MNRSEKYILKLALEHVEAAGRDLEVLLNPDMPRSFAEDALAEIAVAGKHLKYVMESKSADQEGDDERKGEYDKGKIGG